VHGVKRLGAIAVAVVVLLLTSSLGAGCSGSSKPLRHESTKRPPDILVVVLDTTRQDRVSAYGKKNGLS
jgi:hypothetical protein